MKTFLISIGAFVAVIVLLFIAPHVVPTTHYKDAVIREIGQFVEGNVSAGSFRFQILPYPAFSMRDLVVTTTKEPFQTAPVFQAALVTAELSPSGLFRGKMIMDFVLRNVTFDYKEAADGTSNVKFLIRENREARGQKGGKYIIRSVIMTNGTLRIQKKDSPQPLVVDQIEAATSEIKYETAVSAAVRLSGILKGEPSRSVSLAGLFVLDRSQHIIEARQVDIYFGGSRFRADATVYYDTKVFDIHVATPSATVQSLAQFIPELANGLPLGIEIANPMAIDAFLSGTKENIKMKFHVDATASKVGLGRILVKEPNVPLKIAFEGNYQQTLITIEDVTFSFGDNVFHLMGSVFDQPGYPAQLTLSSTTFDAIELKAYFPFLAFLDEFTNPTMTISVQGPLIEDAGRSLSGHMTADKMTTLGHTLSNLQTDFQYSNSMISLSTVKGLLYDGLLSGNGTIDIKAIPVFHFELVVDNLDAAKIPAMPTVLTGIASLVVKADATGADNTLIKESFATEGTLVLPTGEIAPLKVGMQILTDPVWKTIDLYVPNGVDAESRSALSALGGEVKALRASFQLKNSVISMPKVEWSHPQYNALAKGSINLQGGVTGDGVISITKDVVARLIKDAATRKTVTTSDGRLEIPFVVSGTLMAMATRPDDAKLADNLRRTTSPGGVPAAGVIIPAAPPEIEKEALTSAPPPTPVPAPLVPAKEVAPVPAPSEAQAAVAPAAPMVQEKTPEPSVPATAALPSAVSAPSKKKTAAARTMPQEGQEQTQQVIKKKTTKITPKRGRMTTETDENVMKVIIGK